MSDRALREHVAALLGWEDAHAGVRLAVEGVPQNQWTARAAGLPHSLWQLLEHIRLAQHDILDFCRNPNYVQPNWPDDYWPGDAELPAAEAVAASLSAYLADLKALTELAGNPGVDLFARIPHGTGQTYLRELFLVADHTSYHVGQMVDVRRTLGIWG